MRGNASKTGIALTRDPYQIRVPAEGPDIQ